MPNLFSQKFDELVELSKILGEKLVNIKDEIVKPSSFYKGENFENYVENILFPDEYYVLVRRTDTYERNLTRFSESTFDPDFVFRCKKTNFQFAVEAKYRTGLNKDSRLSWSKKYQMDRYIKFNSEFMPVFIAAGLKGVSEKPESIYLFPLCFRENRYINLDMKTANKYKLEFPDKPVLIEHLEKLLKPYSE
jgi:hypothetical protein